MKKRRKMVNEGVPVEAQENQKKKPKGHHRKKKKKEMDETKDMDNTIEDKDELNTIQIETHDQNNAEENNKEFKKEKKKKKKRKRKKDKDAEIVDNGQLNNLAKDDDFKNIKEKSEEIEEGNLNELSKIETMEPVKEKKNKENKMSKPFKRVNAEDWINYKGIQDNSYYGNFGNEGWGAKANEKLSTVKGKDFRHQKTKKKRGTYKGGKIDIHNINSFKFDSD